MDPNPDKVVFMAIALLMAQLFFILIDRKKDRKQEPQSSWSMKLIQLFLGFQGLTIFALPWFDYGGMNSLRYDDLSSQNYGVEFSKQITLYSLILYYCYILMISSSIFQIVLRVNKKSTFTYVYEMTISVITIITGVLLINYVKMNFKELAWPMNICGGPEHTLDIIVRYGIYVIFVIGTVNALFQSILFFNKTWPKNNKIVDSDPELLDVID